VIVAQLFAGELGRPIIAALERHIAPFGRNLNSDNLGRCSLNHGEERWRNLSDMES
jgi:hypothetical protein